MKKFLLTFLTLALGFCLTKEDIFASSYGTSSFGSGAYSVGPTATPMPTQAPSSSSTSNSSGGSSSNALTSCTSFLPTMAPDLYQIDTTSTAMSVYFAPVPKPVTSYQISYGLQANEDRYTLNSPSTNPTIMQLSPNTTYYVRVRAFNDCSPGPWGNTVKVKTTQAGSRYRSTFYKNTLSYVNKTIQITNKGKTVASLPLPQVFTQNMPQDTIQAAPPKQVQPQPQQVAPSVQQETQLPAPTQVKKESNWFANIVSSIKSLFFF